MERLMKGRTSIVIAHRLSTVRSLDRILVFDHGKIVEQGTHATLTARPGGIYRGLFERQATEFSRISAAG
jgi:ATP-binding cassette subfamily B protein